MHKIALVIAYFGTLPSYAPVFFESLKWNSTIDLLLITDQPIKSSQENIKVFPTSFESLQERIQSKFPFQICLDRPYKLCDYKPAYGFIFEDELRNYDFWGHCDLDMVLGDVRKFLPEDVLNTYDKIYEFGHLCLYRNTHENNRRFMLNGGMDYRHVFTSPIICVFDEVMGMQKKFDILGIPSYTSRDCADISPWHYTFQRAESFLNEDEKSNFNYAHQVFFWENGNVYRAATHNDQIVYDEFNYLHFQKRNLSFVDSADGYPKAFFCTKDGFIPKEPGLNITIEEIKKYNGNNPWNELQSRLRYHIFVFKRRFNKYILKK